MGSETMLALDAHLFQLQTAPSGGLVRHQVHPEFSNFGQILGEKKRILNLRLWRLGVDWVVRFSIRIARFDR